MSLWKLFTEYYTDNEYAYGYVHYRYRGKPLTAEQAVLGLERVRKLVEENEERFRVKELGSWDFIIFLEYLPETEFEKLKGMLAKEYEVIEDGKKYRRFVKKLNDCAIYAIVELSRDWKELTYTESCDKSR